MITTGAEVMDQIFRPKQRRTSTATNGVFESDEELEQFLAHVYAARHANLA